MRLGPLGIPELLIIMVIIMLIFGAKRLPEIGTSLGQGIRSFKSGISGDSGKTEEDEKQTMPSSTSDEPL